MIIIRTTALAALLVLAAACGRGQGDASAARDTTRALPPSLVELEAMEEHGHEGEAAGDTTLRLRHDGIGPLRVGMTVDQARAALGHFRPLGPDVADPRGEPALACQHATSVRLPAGVLVMLEGGRVVRVDVDTATVATADGARVGDTEARIRQLYPGRVQAQPHKYGDGEYLVVRAAQPADTTHLLIFETDGRGVQRFRAGQKPQVEYVEGCA